MPPSYLAAKLKGRRGKRARKGSHLWTLVGPRVQGIPLRAYCERSTPPSRGGPRVGTLGDASHVRGRGAPTSARTPGREEGCGEEEDPRVGDGAQGVRSRNLSCHCPALPAGLEFLLIHPEPGRGAQAQAGQETPQKPWALRTRPASPGPQLSSCPSAGSHGDGSRPGSGFQLLPRLAHRGGRAGARAL